MKRSKFSASLIIDAVKRANSGIVSPDIYREIVVSSDTSY
jgi:hypothetical protein